MERRASTLMPTAKRHDMTRDVKVIKAFASFYLTQAQAHSCVGLNANSFSGVAGIAEVEPEWAAVLY